jgi:hypothetical protein
MAGGRCKVWGAKLRCRSLIAPSTLEILLLHFGNDVVTILWPLCDLAQLALGDAHLRRWSLLLGVSDRRYEDIVIPRQQSHVHQCNLPELFYHLHLAAEPCAGYQQSDFSSLPGDQRGPTDHFGPIAPYVELRGAS